MLLRLLSLLLFAAAGLAAPVQAAPTPVRIALLPAVGVVGDDVKLGDVALLATTDLALLRGLLAMSLGPAPRLGEQIELARATVTRWIESRLGPHAVQLEWDGPEGCQLRRAAPELPGERLVAAARESVRAWLGERSARADAMPVGSVRDMVLPPGHVALRPRPLPADTVPARRLAVWVDVWVQQQFVRSVPVQFELAGYEEYAPATGGREAMAVAAMATAGAATAGRSNAESKYALQMVPDRGMARSLVPTVASADAIRSAQRNDEAQNADPRLAASTGNASAPWAVLRGQSVALRVRSGLIELESRVEALQNGRVGQSVQVKPASAAAPLVARVVGAGRVEVLQ